MEGRRLDAGLGRRSLPRRPRPAPAAGRHARAPAAGEEGLTTVLHQYGSRLSDAIRERFGDAVDVVELPPGEAAPAGTKGEVLYALFGSDAVFDQLADLGVAWVQLPGTGVDAFHPLDRFAGVTLTCARGTSATAISEFVLASMLLFEKRLTEVWLREPPARWNIPESTLGTLHGRTLGLIGLGGIGAAIAARALPFGMRVVAFRRHPDRPSPVAGVEVVGSLDDLLPVADHLVVAAPATDATAHLLDARAFGRVKPGVHLVNIARGTLVDHDALRAALDDGRVACASLDVADPEPVPAGHWLYDHPRVRLTAHVSWSMPGGFENISGYFLANLDRYLRGAPLDGVVDLTEGY